MDRDEALIAAAMANAGSGVTYLAYALQHPENRDDALAQALTHFQVAWEEILKIAQPEEEPGLAPAGVLTLDDFRK